MKDKEFRMSAKTLILPLFLILLCCVLDSNTNSVNSSLKVWD